MKQSLLIILTLMLMFGCIDREKSINDTLILAEEFQKHPEITEINRVYSEQIKGQISDPRYINGILTSNNNTSQGPFYETVLTE